MSGHGEVGVVRYLTHPEVVVDPLTPVPQWRLSARGRDRLLVMLTRSWVLDVHRVVSSAERKALEAATLLADHLDLVVETRPASGELDRSATGYVPAATHEQLADECFGAPERSAGGWERAVDAQARIVAELEDLVTDDGPDVAVVGHGGVGTLWWCHLAGEPIARRWDQPGQGHYFTVERGTRRPVHHWRSIDG